MITLDLAFNQIDDQGAQDLANALQHNNVTILPTFRLIQRFTHYFSQTLTTLNLSSNETGDLGAQHLADALQHNNVKQS